MINTLYGILFTVDPVGCSVVIECAGVGYRVQVSAGTLSKLPSPGARANVCLSLKVVISLILLQICRTGDQVQW